ESMTTTDTVTARQRCAYCRELFTPNRYDNQHQRAGLPTVPTLYCSGACKQAAYRRRKDIAADVPASARKRRAEKVRLFPRVGSGTRAENIVPPTHVRGSVTRAEKAQENQSVTRPFFTTEATLRRPRASDFHYHWCERLDGSLDLYRDAKDDSSTEHV